MITKHDLDRSIAVETGVGVQKVARVTASLYSLIRRGLVQDGEIRLDGLGYLRAHVCKLSKGTVANLTNAHTKKGQKQVKRKVEVTQQLRVNFSKSYTLSEMLRERYGGNSGRRRRHGQVRRRRGREVRDPGEARG